jgi:hypothetical protein
MSRGLGDVQRGILSIIEANSDGAWTVEELCQKIYQTKRVEKKHRVAVIRALIRMKLPGTWTTRRLHRAGTALCLYDTCSDESMMRAAYAEAPEARQRGGFNHWQRDGGAERALEDAAEARRWRDASPIELLDLQIAQAEKYLTLNRMLLRDSAHPRAFMPNIERVETDIAALKAERTSRR